MKLLLLPLVLMWIQVQAEEIISGGDKVPLHLLKNQTYTLVDWNIHKEHGSDFLKEFNILKNASDIFTLQEVELDGATIDLWNAYEGIEWFMAEAWSTSNGPTGTGLLSKYVVDKAEAVVSDKGQPISATPKSSIVAYMTVEGSTEKLLVITTHALNFTGVNPFANQLEEVAIMVRAHTGPVLWSGDFNTWNGSRREHLWKLMTSLGLAHIPLEGDEPGEGLDHVFQRGISVTSAQKLEDFHTSDHKPLLIKFGFN